MAAAPGCRTPNLELSAVGRGLRRISVPQPTQGHIPVEETFWDLAAKHTVSIKSGLPAANTQVIIFGCCYDFCVRYS